MRRKPDSIWPGYLLHETLLDFTPFGHTYHQAGNGESFLIKNTKKQQATSEDFTIAFEQNKIICPRCVKIIEHAESLVKYIPLIESQEVVSICDHCHRKGEKKRPRSTCSCRHIVNKFLIGKQLEELKMRKHRTKQWLLEAHQVLQNNSSGIDKIVTGLIRNKAMDKDMAQVDHVPFKHVTPMDSSPTRLKVRQLPFPEIVYTDLHGLKRRDQIFDNAMPKVNPVDNLKFKQLEPIDGPSTGLKIRKPSFPESIHTDSHGLMRRDPSLDNSMQKHFEKHLLNRLTREPTLTKLSEEKQLGIKERKETAPFKVASFLDVPEENVNPNMFIISKSQGGKIKETQRRPSLKRAKNLATERESRGLLVTSNLHSPKGSSKPVSKHDRMKVFSFLFPQEILQTSSSFRFASSTELLKNMQDMFKAQAEEKKLAKDNDFKRKREREREREKNKIIDVAQLITGENEKKSNTAAETNENKDLKKKEKKEQARIEMEQKDGGKKEQSKIGQEKKREKEDGKGENAYTAAETNENKDHKKKEKKEQARKEMEQKDGGKKEQSKIGQEKKREKEDGKGKEEKDKIKKDKQEQDRIDKEEKRREKQDQIHKNKDKYNDVKDETVISKDEASKGATLKDGKQKREKPGDEKLKPEKAKEDNVKHVTGKEEKQKDLVGKDDKSKKKVPMLHTREPLDTSQSTFKEKPGDEKLKPDKTKENTKDKKKHTDLKYTLVTSQPTLILKDKPEEKVFNVVIPARPKPVMVVEKPKQEPIKKEIKLTQTREELIMKLIRLKQEQYGSREKYKPKKPGKTQIESKEAYALYTESDVLLELAELEISKHPGPSKRGDDDLTIIIGTQIVQENLNREEEIKSTPKA